MHTTPIWRYLSLAKYIDLLRKRALFFPKAALFQDENEGKWFAHAVLYERRQRNSQIPENARKLEDLLAKAGHDQSAILLEAKKLLDRGDENTKWLQNILRTVSTVYAHKRREYLDDTLSKWWKMYNDHDPSTYQWRSQIQTYRESTYISCWNQTDSMSLAMWELYGGGREAVTVRSTREKLEALIENNRIYLEAHNLEGGVADVRYIEGLRSPDEIVKDQIYQILEEAKEYRIGQFAIKPSIFRFEEEVRAVVYPKTNLFDSVEDPHPDKIGFYLSIEQSRPSSSHFIEAVYIHPTLGYDSMMFQVLKEIHNHYGMAEIPIIADRLEALGLNIKLPPISSSE